MEQREVFHRRLKVEVAYHSSRMDPLESELVDALSSLAPGSTRVPLYSSVTGKRMSGEDLGPGYWWRNMRETVRFADAMQRSPPMITSCFWRWGRIRCWRNPLRNRCGRPAPGRDRGLVTPRQAGRPAHGRGARLTLQRGQGIAWRAISPDGSEFVKLPSYPWQRASYWYESSRSRQDRLGNEGHVFPERRPAFALAGVGSGGERRLFPVSERPPDRADEGIPQGRRTWKRDWRCTGKSFNRQPAVWKISLCTSCWRSTPKTFECCTCNMTRARRSSPYTAGPSRRMPLFGSCTPPGASWRAPRAAGAE